MQRLTKKLLEKLNVVLLLAVMMVGGLGVASYVLAGNTANQQASTSAATTVSVVGKVADTAITTITFPVAAASATVSIPYNNVDTVSSSQVLSATVSEPVVRLKNTSAGTLDITLQIDTWTNGVVSAEYYSLVPVATTTVNTVTSALSADGNSATVDTSTTIGAGAYDGLYLKLVLSAVAGQTGTSTLTVLGQTP